MPLKTYTITLENTQQITQKVRHFCFSCDDTNINQFTPGQFITAHILCGDTELKRSYSLANKRINGNIEFAASYVPNGPASELLFNMLPGDTLNISGPYGRLILRDDPISRYIFIGTSTGITPYLSMLQSLEKRLHANDKFEVVIIQGVQYKKDVLYEDAFLTFAERHENASFFSALSQEENSHLAPHEHSGHVQCVLKRLKPHPEKDIVYLCGNPAMIDDTFERLKALDFPIKNIRREKYISR